MVTNGHACGNLQLVMSTCQTRGVLLRNINGDDLWQEQQAGKQERKAGISHRHSRVAIPWRARDKIGRTKSGIVGEDENIARLDSAASSVRSRRVQSQR